VEFETGTEKDLFSIDPELQNAPVVARGKAH
jgi:hypothetical protein